ncbi:cell cycle checkpoint control protein RAD9A isoform X1 [Kryptolebias marmoratus]|uniref:Cell cycle checkpoint control protein n=1 Tax=Kryptolebias marmoratus TaxID=37003 RepID=A0A3Q3AGR7_KRYMA|nr:cell cycle checkpoint control protein RAD9A isoform X1 [Kryptolebias marmoratus]
MQCVVTGGNVKVLAKAVHSLSRIGDELYVEPQEDGLALRSVNSSRSAYACFLFAPLFFSRYSIDRGLDFRCKLAVKSVQTVFRSVATLEKTVEKCHVELDKAKDRLTFTLHCKHGLLKTHNLSYQDTESLQAVFDKDSCANVFRAQSRVLVETVVHFPPSVEEVTVAVSSERMWVRNHVEDEAERSKALLTELCLAADEFDHFAVGAPNSITFCLKELRGLLVFAESTGLPVSVYFHEPGSPVVFSVTDSVLEGNFVLATLSDDHNLQKSDSGGGHAEPPPPPPDDFMNDDIDSYLIAMDTSVVPGPSTAPPSAASRASPAADSRTRKHSEEEEEEERDGNEDPGRPPSKKFRSLFFGSVLPPSPQTSTQPVTTQEVLASDSEDEDE